MLIVVILDTNITHDGKLQILLCAPQVESLVERVIVFLLSQVVERELEVGSLFSLHPRTESCKLLWRDGQAVGFYTVKHKGETEGRGVGAAFLGGAVCSFHPVNILQLCLSPAGSPSQSCFLISINGPRCLQRVQRRRSQSKTFLSALFTHTVKQIKAVSVMPLPHLSLKDAVNCKCV